MSAVTSPPVEPAARRPLTDYIQPNAGELKPLGYLMTYERYFGPLQDSPIKMLELGVANGHSLRMWHDYFPKGTVVGVEMILRWQPDPDDTRIRVYQGAQNDPELLDRIAAEIAPDGFDIIIDDCAHIGQLAKESFWHLFDRHLKPGGFYAIEDWGTGYLGGYRNVYYPDGEFFDPRERETIMHWMANKVLKHAPVEWQETSFFHKLFKRHQYTRHFKIYNYGLVGFVTQLIAEIGAADNTSPGAQREDPPQIAQRRSKFKDILYTPGVVVVTKA